MICPDCRSPLDVSLIPRDINSEPGDGPFRRTAACVTCPVCDSPKHAWSTLVFGYPDP